MTAGLSADLGALAPGETAPGTLEGHRLRTRATTAATMRLGHQVKRSCRDATAASSDPGHGPARAPDPQADRPAALHHLGHRDHRAGGGRDRGERDHDRRGDRHHRRERAVPVRPARGGTDRGPVRHPHHSRRAGRPAGLPAPGAESRRGGGYRPPGRGPWRPWPTSRSSARFAEPALRRDHHVPAGRQPRRGARPVPGRPGGVRDDHRPVRAARLAERPVAGHRRLRPRAPGGDWTPPSCRSC